eukprot:6073173-Pyramimonas_sp.AAC.1
MIGPVVVVRGGIVDPALRMCSAATTPTLVDVVEQLPVGNDGADWAVTTSPSRTAPPIVGDAGLAAARDAHHHVAMRAAAAIIARRRLALTVVAAHAACPTAAIAAHAFIRRAASLHA